MEKYFRKLILLTALVLAQLKFSIVHAQMPILDSLMAHGDGVIKSYQYSSPERLSVVRLILRRDRTYVLLNGTDIAQSFSLGSWQRVKDTLLLNSSIDQRNIPMIINGSADSSDSVTVEMVKDLDGNVIKGAIVFINGDTRKGCMPAFGECKFQKGVIQKIKLELNNNASTRWYSIEEREGAKITPILQLKFRLDNYIFFKDKKYLIVGNKLYDIVSQGNSGVQIDKTYFLTNKINEN